MELKELLGRRRTIRFFLPFRPVEREKVQKMLEAGRRASCVGNVNNTRAVVVWKDQASAELIQALTPPLGYQQMQTAPCFIVWYSDSAAYEVNAWIDAIKNLADQRRIGTDPEETKALVDRALKPIFGATWQQAAVAPLAFMDVGQAVAQATLVAYDEGLGTCLMSGPVMVDRVNKLLKLPESATLVCIMSVGYPAESWEAGGQTGKAPFGDLFAEMEYGKPFDVDSEVWDELREAKMLQEEAPLPWRDEELEYVVRGLGIEEQRQIGTFQMPGSTE
jgi:nitroreductase